MMKCMIALVGSLGLGVSTMAGGAAAPTGIDLAAMEGWDIVIAPGAIDSERYAAEEFRDHFQKATGVALPIVTKVDRADRHVFVGPGPAMRAGAVGFDVDAMGEEDLRIVVRDELIAIAGGRPRGTLYGVYTFLEDYLDVRFLTHDHTHVPPVGPWRMIGPLDRTYRPPLSFRWPFYGEMQNQVFAARLRCNTVTHQGRLGGATGTILINHTFNSLIPSREYGREHPEYYCLIDGKRLSQVKSDSYDNEPCLTNPDVLRIVTQATLEEIKRHPERTNVSVSQNDNDKYCRCDRCAAIDAKEGTPMGSLLTFVNAVADEVAKHHPEVKVGTLAYWYSRHTPETIKPRDNVMIQLASIECSMIQPIADPDSKLNAAFCRDLEAWGRISENISVWNYNTNFSNYLLPCPNLRVIEPNIRFFVANRARGLFMQAAGNARGAELSDLRNYLIARLLWDPNRSGQRIIDEFLDLHYRSAAPPIRRFIDLVHDNAEAKGVERNCSGSAKDYGIDDTIAQAGLETFEEALALADDDAVRARVEKASVCAFRAAVEDAWVWAEQHKGNLDEQTMPAEIARRTRPHAKRLFELCDTYGVTNWNETNTIDVPRDLLRRAFGLAEGEDF